jgi:hypothetical protein
VYSNIELFRGKHQKTQHCNLSLLVLISSYFYLKNSENLGQEFILCTEEEILMELLTFE